MSESPATRARRERAEDNRTAALVALSHGLTLIVSNRTDIAAGLIHATAARALVRSCAAEYMPGPFTGAALDKTRIQGRSQP